MVGFRKQVFIINTNFSHISEDYKIYVKLLNRRFLYTYSLFSHMKDRRGNFISGSFGILLNNTSVRFIGSN